jgi:prolipoprotein diacylglyceryltransferase
MGQILSTPMIVAGVVLMVIAYRRDQPSGNIVVPTVNGQAMAVGKS